MHTSLAQEFFNRYQKEPEHIFFSPGRINLIGEHIDYNGGSAMPCAIEQGTWLAVSRNLEKNLKFQCLNFTETAQLHLQQSYTRSGKQWFNYPLGIIHEFLQTEKPVSGLDMLFVGNLPIGAGLSSSASIEVLTAFALNEIFEIGFSKKDLSLLAKKTENEFIGVNCGVMDQFAVTFGKKDQAILLNCDTLDYEYIPLLLGDFMLAIIFTNKPRNLVESRYNERFAECRLALQFLEKHKRINHLCDLAPEEFELSKHLIQDATLEKRALHVITENDRVHKAKKALQKGMLSEFGKLMYASHQSLRDLYEVSGQELDAIVDFCKVFKDCIGARMTGAGFGGCAIALIRKNSFEKFSNALTASYEKQIGYKPLIFSSEAGDGVRKLPWQNTE
jgi:galactokinase